ncbi:MAG: hypothetical protein NTZ32_13210 [Planctomycetales bacterium]|nr:hypothetical protein [Planctomycetales bacterium]
MSRIPSTALVAQCTRRDARSHRALFARHQWVSSSLSRVVLPSFIHRE